MEEFPFVSVIVPVRNAERTLDKTFEYLLKINYPRDKWEIVIADGGSHDATIGIIKRWQSHYSFVKLVEIPDCPSPGFARNRALEVTKGEFIFFTDGDCAPCESWILEMLKHFRNDPKIGIVGGEIYTLRVNNDNLTEIYCENFRFNMVSPRYNFINEGYFPPLSDMTPTQIAGHRAYFFVTANVAYRKEMIDKSNIRFWERPTGEDIEFGLKAQKEGWRLYFAPKARVDHMHRANFKALRRVWVSYGKAHAPLINEYATFHLEIVFQFLKNKPRLKVPSKIKGFIYIGNFHLMHIFGIMAIFGLIFNTKLFIISLVLTFFFAYRYFYYCLLMEPKKHILTWFKMKYLTNLSFIRGGLKGIKEYKVFCIEPSF